MQGVGNTLLTLQQAVFAFENKLERFIKDIETDHLLHFEKLREFKDACAASDPTQHLDIQQLAGFTSDLLQSFKARFGAFREHTRLFKFITHPHECEVDKADLIYIPGVSIRDFEIEVADLKASEMWVNKFKTLYEDLEGLARQQAELASKHKWSEMKKLQPADQLIVKTWNALPVTYRTLQHVSIAVLTMFGSTYAFCLQNIFLITQTKSWPDAQTHCRTKYTDLSLLSNEVENQAFTSSVSQTAQAGWIGLYSDATSPSRWKWSGGTNATYLSFDHGYQSTPGRVLWTPYGWKSKYPDYFYNNFFCLNLIVVEEKKTWEEALEHCRDKHTDFTSLLSQTEVLLAQRQIQKNSITDQVWVGLRYLEDSWLWVNLDPLEFVAWPETVQDHQCPTWSHSCGALTKKGLWEYRDCQEKLNFICY
ncbi:lymphocyte antigen 75-like [Thalassophryne amazonica]|uniref:lymphocyte antigen 75-like n=1 Tax=Thalassophryne amazonica TaxID=390379 RepID=UPI0014712DC3|nr:lymphocyte antigen 75-like [Thalassophryne amazonica]